MPDAELGPTFVMVVVPAPTKTAWFVRPVSSAVSVEPLAIVVMLPAP